MRDSAKRPTLVLAKPPKPVKAMTGAERRDWERKIAERLQAARDAAQRAET